MTSTGAKKKYGTFWIIFSWRIWCCLLKDQTLFSRLRFFVFEEVLLTYCCYLAHCHIGNTAAFRNLYRPAKTIFLIFEWKNVCYKCFSDSKVNMSEKAVEDDEPPNQIMIHTNAGIPMVLRYRQNEIPNFNIRQNNLFMVSFPRELAVNRTPRTTRSMDISYAIGLLFKIWCKERFRWKFSGKWERRHSVHSVAQLCWRSNHMESGKIRSWRDGTGNTSCSFFTDHFRLPQMSLEKFADESSFMSWIIWK